jgi:hypothetical protein
MRLGTELLDITIGMHNVFGDVVARIREFEASGRAVLRWGLIKSTDGKIALEVAAISADAVAQSAHAPSVDSREYSPGTPVALVIPTGVGATVGGYIGDAGPVAQVLETVADTVIIHPNVVNAADFYSGGHRSLYVDGLTLDRFFSGSVRLAKSTKSRIGLVMDSFTPEMQSQLLNAANALRAVKGVELIGYSISDEKIRVKVSRSDFGHFIGEVENIDCLFDATVPLIEQGANSIAVVTALGGASDLDWACHYAGEGPNPIGSVEALISRAITWKFGVACAHAPAFAGPMGHSLSVVDPRAAAEVASGTGLPCVLYGLRHAPRNCSDGWGRYC